MRNLKFLSILAFTLVLTTSILLITVSSGYSGDIEIMLGAGGFHFRIEGHQE